MKNQFNALKLTGLGAAVGLLGVGCASSGYARYDVGADNMAMGHAAEAEMGQNRSLDPNYDGAAADTTVSAFGCTVDTRADWVNRFPFYDVNLRAADTYILTAENSRLDSRSTHSEFIEAQPPVAGGGGPHVMGDGGPH